MKKIVKTLVASVAAILLLFSCILVPTAKNTEVASNSNQEQEQIILCFKGDEWENS